MVYVGSNLGRFYAIDRDGQLLWEYLPWQPNPFLASIVVPSPIGSPVQAVATPIVGGAVLPRTVPYVIFGDLDGNLYALDRETGEEVWAVAANPHPLGGIVGNSLLVVGDTLYVGFASLENLGLVLGAYGYPCCSHQGAVAAFDVRTGAELWRTLTSPDAVQPLDPALSPHQLGPSGADIWGQPTYDEESNTLFVATGQNFSPNGEGEGTAMSDAVIALDADSGAIKWHYQATENDIWNVGVATPDENGVYYDQDFGDSPKIYELEGIGKVVGLGQKSGEYHVVEAATGELIASTLHAPMANALGGFQNLGAMAHDRIFQHGLSRIGPPGSPLFDGVVVALSPDGVDELWRFDERFLAPLAGGLAVANDVIYLVSPGAFPVDPAWFPGEFIKFQPSLLALDARTGELLHEIDLAGEAVSSPVIVDGRVYAGEGNTAIADLGVDESGGLVAFGLPGDD